MSDTYNSAGPIYQRSSSLRPYINQLKESLLTLQEVSLNSAINASQDRSSSDENSVYNVVANLIRKNSDRMLAILSELNDKFNDIIRLSLFAINTSTKKNRLIFASRKIDKNKEVENIKTINLAIDEYQELFQDRLKEILIEIELAISLHSRIKEHNKKLWLASTSLKIENNVYNNQKSFFYRVAEILDEKTEFMTVTINQILHEVLVIEEMVKKNL